MIFAGLAEWLCSSLPSWLRGFDSRTLLQKDRQKFAEKMHEMVLLLQKRDEIIEKLEQEKEWRKSSYRKSIIRLSTENGALKKRVMELKSEIDKGAVTKVEYVFLNEHGGIIRK